MFSSESDMQQEKSIECLALGHKLRKVLLYLTQTSACILSIVFIIDLVVSTPIEQLEGNTQFVGRTVYLTIMLCFYVFLISYGTIVWFENHPHLKNRDEYVQDTNIVRIVVSLYVTSFFFFLGGLIVEPNDYYILAMILFILFLFTTFLYIAITLRENI